VTDGQFLGEIRLFGFNFVPQGWAKCEGQLMSIGQNQALFALLGTTYGGDGQQRFALPDLRKVPLGPVENWCIAVQGMFPSRQ
jgi:microcystin-dependent protein